MFQLFKLSPEQLVLVQAKMQAHELRYRAFRRNDDQAVPLPEGTPAMLVSCLALHQGISVMAGKRYLSVGYILADDLASRYTSDDMFYGGFKSGQDCFGFYWGANCRRAGWVKLLASAGIDIDDLEPAPVVDGP